MLEILIFIKKILLLIKNFLKKIKFFRILKKSYKEKINFLNKKFILYFFYPQEYDRFKKDRRKFNEMGGKIDEIREALIDFKSEAGVTKGHYFNQDLLVANFIHIDNPKRHIDIGSRIDGFVAHVASFREIEVMDIRPLKPTKHKNIKFIQKDFMLEENQLEKICDSVSSLHALEHFGLGRYNDQIDPDGHLKGFKNMVKMLTKGGKIYISFPIGKKKVIFNQRRVFSPDEIIKWEKNIKLLRFDFVDDNGDLHTMSEFTQTKELKYGCGIYTFIKTE